jgi:TusA-related sulfurtransferase
VHIPPAQAMLDAGEAEPALLLSAIARRIDELPVGQVLEVVSTAAGAHLDAAAWCHANGHELIALLATRPVTRFWIRKCARAD